MATAPATAPATATATESPIELRITRTLDAPQERVFAAWTDPAQLARWWGPKSYTLPAMEADIRPGGNWRACIRSPEGEDHWMGGTWQEIDPVERLVFSFAWESPDALLTLITVTLKPEGDKTRLTFHQTPFRDVESRDSHMGGWTSCLDCLDDLLLQDAWENPAMATTDLDRSTSHPILPHKDWLEARKALLGEEKALTRAHDRLNEARRALPWERVETDYRFEGPDGPLGLADLFGRNSQLILYHFMFGPGWSEGCKSCSLLADHLDGIEQHLRHHDVTLAAVSLAPLAEFLPFKARMGWRFPWVSSAGSSFNFDFQVSATETDKASDTQPYNYATLPGAWGEMPGVSVFTKDDEGTVFHTYSAFARGLDILLGVHNFLDLTPKGRNETTIMDWVRHHDRYPNRATSTELHRLSDIG